MKEIEKYLCEICNTEYSNKEEAQECEKAHCEVVQIISAYKPKKLCGKYPVAITAEFKDGYKRVYKF